MTTTKCAPFDAGTILAGKRRTITVRFTRETDGASLAGSVVTITRTRTGTADDTITPTVFTATADVATVTFTVVFADAEQAGPSIVTVDLDSAGGIDIDATEVAFVVQARTTP